MSTLRGVSGISNQKYIFLHDESLRARTGLETTYSSVLC